MLSLFTESLKRKKLEPVDLSSRLAFATGQGEPSHRRQGIEPPSPGVYFSTIQHYQASLRKVEEILVNKITVAITMAAPHMTAERIEHALFVKQIYMSGEIHFDEYIQKMWNLYPQRMQNIPDDLKQRIEACQQMLRERS